MFDLETLRSRLRLDASGFSAGLDGAARSVEGFRSRIGGVGSGLLDVGSKLGLASIGLRELGSVAQGAFSGLFGSNVAIENVTAQLTAFTGSGEEAKRILADIRQEADHTPFAFNEMAAAVAGLLPASKQSGVALMDLVKQAEILAAVNPAEGLEGAAFSLREALSGDFTSVIERFNLPRQRLNELRDQGVPAMEAISIALKEMGIDYAVVSNMANTATGRWSTFMDTLNSLKATALQRAFEVLSGALVPLQGWLDANNERLTKFATLAGEKLANGLVRLGRAIRAIAGSGLGSGLREFLAALLKGRSIPDALRAIGGDFTPKWIVRLASGLDAVREHIAALFGFVSAHRGTLKTLAAGFVSVWAAVSAGGVVVAVVGGLIAALASPLLLLAGLVGLFAAAYIGNWGGIRDITDSVVGTIVDGLGWVWKAIEPVIDVLIELGGYFLAVAAGADPLGDRLKALPGWLQPIAYVLGRVVKTLRVFFKTWADKGFLAAIRTIPTQIRAFGRAISGLLDSIDLGRAADAIRVVFNTISQLFGHLVDLADDVIHGRWSQVWGDLGRVVLDAIRLWAAYGDFITALLVDIFHKIPWGTIGQVLLNGLIAAGQYMVDVGIPWLTVKGLELIGALWEGMVGFWNDTVLPWFGELMGNIPAYFGGAKDLLFQVGNDIIGGLADGITWAWEWVTGWLAQMPDWIGRFFSGAKYVLWQAGAEIIMGLWDGIVWAWNWLSRQLTALWNQLPGWARSAWESNSPSKVFARIGETIPEGLAVGIRDGMGEVTRAMAGMDATVSGARFVGMPALAAAGGAGRGGDVYMTVHAAPGQNEEMIAEKVARKINRQIDIVRAAQR